MPKPEDRAHALSTDAERREVQQLLEKAQLETRYGHPDGAVRWHQDAIALLAARLGRVEAALEGLLKKKGGGNAKDKNSVD